MSNSFVYVYILTSAICLCYSQASNYGDLWRKLNPLPEWTRHNSEDSGDYFRQLSDDLRGQVLFQNIMKDSTDVEDRGSKLNNLIKEYAEDGFSSRFQESSPYNVSEPCLNHTMEYFQSLFQRDIWALKMFDAVGKIPSGIFRGHFLWSGDFDECREVVANITTLAGLEPAFYGKYCSLTSAIPLNIGPNGTKTPLTQSGGALAGLLLQIGLCLPDSCSDADAIALVHTGLSLLPLNVTAYGLPLKVTCVEDPDFSKDTRAIVVVCLLSLFVLMLILGTIYDLYNDQNCEKVDEGENSEAKGGNPVIQKVIDDESLPLLGIRPEKPKFKTSPGTGGKILLAFSLYSNANKILSTKQGEGTLRCLNGIRFLSLNWVMLGHTFAFAIYNAINMATYATDVLGRLTGQSIVNGTYSVDSFFLLSGLLVTYLTMKEMSKRKGKINWLIYYIHRYWRLTPPMMLVMMVYVPLFKYWGSGPFYPRDGIEKNYCEHSWWQNLLYINNFFKNTDQCMAWGWYLANDMQFYIISPFILLPLYYSGILGSIIIGVFLISTMVASGIISSNDHAGTGVLNGLALPKAFDDIYIKPWCRMGPYLVGMSIGYLLHRTKCQVNIPKMIVAGGWLTAAVIGIAVIYGMKGVNAGSVTLSEDIDALYNATSRTAWALALGWLIFACCTGYGGIINSLLSLDIFIPLSRLTYCAYLVHPVIMFWYYDGQKSPFSLSDVNLVYFFLGHSVLTYGVAFITSLAFEAPMMGLDKIVLQRNRRN